ncbi:MAG: hypothetical protein INR66_22615, partial [Gordonia polyisoprenivorans]|nr:hypothetical protein [Gordonia polyisoprenivorans]
VVLLALDWILWLASALPALVSGLASGTPAYFTVSFVTALFGPLWVLGTAFAVIGFHRGGSARNRTFAIIGAAMTGAMMAVTVLVAMLFAAGMVA